MTLSPIRFVRDADALNQQFLSLKHQPCAHCGEVGTLNRHSFLFGNDPSSASGRTLRGQRGFCSDRGQRGGCGKTFSIFFADVLPRHGVTATLLWRLLCHLLAGLPLKKAAESLSSVFSLETFYHLRRRARQRLDVWRSRLARHQKAPDSGDADPLLQTARHFEAVFPKSPCPLRDFQLSFQQPLTG